VITDLRDHDAAIWVIALAGIRNRFALARPLRF
jgi:hypothetical protein